MNYPPEQNTLYDDPFSPFTNTQVDYLLLQWDTERTCPKARLGFWSQKSRRGGLKDEKGILKNHKFLLKILNRMYLTKLDCLLEEVWQTRRISHEFEEASDKCLIIRFYRRYHYQTFEQVDETSGMSQVQEVSVNCRSVIFSKSQKLDNFARSA